MFRERCEKEEDADDVDDGEASGQNSLTVIFFAVITREEKTFS
jgi:hypothetical protein